MVARYEWRPNRSRSERPRELRRKRSRWRRRWTRTRRLNLEGDPAGRPLRAEECRRRRLATSGGRRRGDAASRPPGGASATGPPRATGWIPAAGRLRTARNGCRKVGTPGRWGGGRGGPAGCAPARAASAAIALSAGWLRTPEGVVGRALRFRLGEPDAPPVSDDTALRGARHRTRRGARASAPARCDPGVLLCPVGGRLTAGRSAREEPALDGNGRARFRRGRAGGRLSSTAVGLVLSGPDRELVATCGPTAPDPLRA